MLWELVLLLMAVLCTAAETQEFFNRSDCPPANEGDTANITFYSSRQKDISSQDLLFFLRKDEGPDILSCIQAARASEVECDQSDNGVTTKGLKGGKLTLVIPNVTKNMLGSYALHVLSREKPYYPSVCKLTILEKDGGRTDKEEAGQDAFLIVGVVAGHVALIGIIVCLTCFIRRRHRKRREQRYCGKQNVERLDSTDLTVITMNGTHYKSPPEERDECTTLLPSPDTDQSLRVVQEKHNENTTVSDNNTNGTHYKSPPEERDECTTLLPSPDTDQSLRVVQEKHNENTAVSDNNIVSRNDPTHEEHQIGNRHSSSTDPASEELNITTPDGGASGAILRPDSKTRDFDEMTLRMDDKLALQHKEPGAFLVRESKTDPEVHMLAVLYKGEVEHFKIRNCGHTFVLEATKIPFNSLSELVHYYQCYKIKTTGGVVYCKLSATCLSDQQRENSEKHENHQTGKPPSPSAYPEQQEEPFTSTQETDSEQNSEKHKNHQTGKPPSPSAYSEQQEEPFTSTQGADSEQNSAKHENHQTGKPSSPSAYPEQQEEPFTSTQGADNEKLVSEKMQRWKENKLLRSSGQGSFRITRNKKAPANYTLAVFWNSKVTHFEIAPHNFKFRFVETGKDFESLSDLVAHYTQHDIRVSNGTLYCKLTTPCTSGPDSD